MKEYNAIVYILNENNKIIKEFPYDFEGAMRDYWNKRDNRGKFYVSMKNKKPPYDWA